EKLAQNWFSANHLNLNSNKTQQLLISKRLEQGVQAGVSLLGVRMDNMLNWSQHIHHLCEKLSGLTFLFRNLRNSLNCEYTIKAYYAIVQSALTYGITLWGNARSEERRVGKEGRARGPGAQGEKSSRKTCSVPDMNRRMTN